MTQRSHVPKFGNWDTENVPYTTYFENARNEKGARMINPNDPEENPSAFSHRAMGFEDHAARPKRKEDQHMHQNLSMQRINLSEHRKSNTTESGSDSDMSLVQSTNNQRVRSRQKKSVGGGTNYSFPPPSPSPSPSKGGRHKPDDCQTHKVASVPKFGSWDETDPKSGEGFTIIFNKVKQEKQIGATKFRADPQLSISSGHKKQRSSPPKAKVCCCFFLRSTK